MPRLRPSNTTYANKHVIKPTFQMRQVLSKSVTTAPTDADSLPCTTRPLSTGVPSQRPTKSPPSAPRPRALRPSPTPMSCSAMLICTHERCSTLLHSSSCDAIPSYYPLLKLNTPRSKSICSFLQGRAPPSTNPTQPRALPM